MKFILNNPAIVISIGALVISILGLLYTFLKDRDNNRRWDSINLSRLVVREVRLANWRTIERAQFGKITWGYSDPLAIASHDHSGNMDIDHLIIPIQIVAVHPQEGVLTGLNCITEGELVHQLAENGKNVKDFTFQKLIRVDFSIENVGATIASDVVYDASIPDGVEGSAKKQPKQLSMKPGERSFGSTSIRIPFGEPFPKELKFSINLSHKDIHGHLHNDLFEYVFEKSVGTFRRT